MAQIVLGGLTTLNLATHLDPMFTELYALRNQFVIVSGNLGIGTTLPVDKLSVVNSAAAVAGAYRDIDVTGTPAGAIFSVGARVGTTLTAAAGFVGNLAMGGATGSMSLQVRSGGGLTERVVIDATGNMFGGADNTQTLGTSSRRWSVVYAGTGAINTSDAREKSKVSPLEDRELAASIALGKEIGAFKFLASMKEKGEGARIHIGMTVQRAMEVMSAHGLNATDYAFICHDTWPAREVPAQTEERDTGLKNSSGEPIRENVTVREAYTEPAGDRYGFRMDQLAMFIMRGIEHRLTQLEALA